jgi:hypothetical protein
MTLSPAPSELQKPRYSWAEVWTAVLTRPSVQTFQEILRDPAVSRARAYIWMSVTWIVAIIFISVLTSRDMSQIMATMPSDMRITPEEMQSAFLMSMLCMLPFVLLIGLATFRVMVWLVQFVARQLGADANYESGIERPKVKNSDPKAEVSTLVMYSFAAIQAPLNIVSLLFAALPENDLIRIISLLPLLYQVYLVSLALRAIYGLSSGRALASSLITFGVFLGATLGLMYLLLQSMM